MIGVRYPLGWDRCALMRRTLMDLYKREHKVSLERLRNVPKREAKTYVEGLAGITPFVASRTLLLGLGIHGVPVDQATVDVLVEAEVLGEASDPVEVAALLSRHVLADDRPPWIGVQKALRRNPTPPADPLRHPAPCLSLDILGLGRHGGRDPESHDQESPQRHVRCVFRQVV
jgi:hypothetical protein